MDPVEYSTNRPHEPTESEIDTWESVRYHLTPLLEGKLYQGGFLDDIAAQVVDAKVGLVVSTSIMVPAQLPNTALLRFPFDDDWRGHPDIKEIRAIARFATDWNKATKQPVMVHCAYGLNRSSLISAFILYEMLEGAWNGREIVDYIQRTRRGTLNNDTFVKAIVRELGDKYPELVNTG